MTGLAVAGGPLIGGAIAERLDWQWIFWLNVPIGLALAPIALRRLPESFGPDVRLDLRGLVLVTGAVLGLVWGLVRGNIAGWGSVEVVGALAGGVLLAAAFVGWQRRAPAPMLPLSLFRSRAFSAGNAAVFFTVGALFCAVFFLAQFFQTALGCDPLEAGLRLLPWTATLFFVAPVAGALVDRFGERPFLVAGPLLQAVGMGWIALVASADMAYTQLVAPLVIAGVGVSMTFPAAQNAVVGAVTPAAVGKAAGINSTARELGGVFGIALGVAVFAGAGGYASPHAFTEGFAAAIALAAGLSLLGALAGAGLPRRVVVGVPAMEAGLGGGQQGGRDVPQALGRLGVDRVRGDAAAGAALVGAGLGAVLEVAPAHALDQRGGREEHGRRGALLDRLARRRPARGAGPASARAPRGRRGAGGWCRCSPGAARWPGCRRPPSGASPRRRTGRWRSWTARRPPTGRRGARGSAGPRRRRASRGGRPS